MSAYRLSWAIRRYARRLGVRSLPRGMRRRAPLTLVAFLARPRGQRAGRAS